MGNDLKTMRINAGLTQAELSVLLDIQQSQISKYEDSPDLISLGLFRKWEAVCGEQQKSKEKIDISDPRKELTFKVNATAQYLSDTPGVSNEHDVMYEYEIKSICRIINESKKKKKLGVFGQFDAGKSRLINELLGINDLPTSYQPTTSVVCLIRHMSDKPSWQAENVWLMAKGFDLNRADDEKHCATFKRLAGDYGALSNHGIHKLSNKEQKELELYAAIVYIDSPLLQAIDIIDLPGYGNDEDDSNKAEMTQKIADAAIYVSSFNGFMNQTDHLYLKTLLQQIPKENNLQNIFVVATRSHLSNGKENILNVLNIASDRLYRNMPLFEQELDLSADKLRDRFYSFSADNNHYSMDFKNSLIEYLTINVKNTQLKEFKELLDSIKLKSTNDIEKQISAWESILSDRQTVIKELKELKEKVPLILEDYRHQSKMITENITKYQHESISKIESEFDKVSDSEHLISIIKSKYSDKKEAQQYLTNYLITNIESRVNNVNKKNAELLSNDINALMHHFDQKIDHGSNKHIKLDLDFDSKTAFISALSGVGTVGALSVWASIVAGGSNLGGYILIAKVVGWLSSIGISVGSSASVMAAVSAIGGPITLAIGIGVLATLGVFALFGASWEEKLAKKASKVVIKEKDKFISASNKYWKETENAFYIAIKEFEGMFIDSINKKENELNQINDVQLKDKITAAKKYLPVFQQLHGPIYSE